jgi:hypothetical protein
VPVICSSGGSSVKLWFLDGTPVAELSASPGLAGTAWPRELFAESVPGGSPVAASLSLGPTLGASPAMSHRQGHSYTARAAQRKSSPGPGPPWSIPTAFSLTGISGSAQPSPRTGGGYGPFGSSVGGPPTTTFAFPLGDTPTTSALPHVRTDFSSSLPAPGGPILDSTRSTHPSVSPMRKLSTPGVAVPGHSRLVAQGSDTWF